MADEGIRVVIAPSSAGVGKRFTETPSFAGEKLGGPRFTAPGVGQRSEINVEKKLVDVQTALVAEIRELRKTMRATAPGTSERTSLQGRIDDLLAQQKRTLTGAAETGAVAREAKALTSRSGAAIMPSARVLAQALVGASRETLQGNPLGAFQRAVSGFNAGRSLIGAGGGAAAAEGAEGAAEAAGDMGIGAALTAIGVAGAAGLAYEAYEHPSGAKGIVGAPLTIMEAKKYGSVEEPRQAAAFRAARLLGDTSGMGMIRATSGGRWSNLGIDPNEATQMVAAMREVGGSRYVSNAQAFKAAQLGTYLGLSPEQSAQVGGQAARLGISPEESIRVIAAGVERGNQQGRQFEVATASLNYLKQIATSAAVSGTTGLTAITNLSAILAKSGIPGFQGAQGVSAISGIESAHRADDIFGAAAAGQAFVTLGEASILRGVNTDKRFAALKPGARLALAEQIRQQGFSGPYARIYGAAIHQEITTATSALGRDYGLEAFEEANNFPVGGYRDPITGKWVSVNDSVLAMDKAFQSGDFLTASRIQSDLLSHGVGNISPMERASAGLAMAGAATGEATARTYASGLRLEAAGLGLLRRHVTDKETASALDYLASTLGPSKPSALSTTAAMGAVGSYDLGGGAAAAAGSALAGPVAEAISAAGTALGAIGAYGMGGGGAAAAAGSAIAGPASAALSGISDDVSGGILLIAGLLERLIAAVERQGGAPGTPAGFGPPAPAAPAAPAHGHTGPTASTPKSPRH